MRKLKRVCVKGVARSVFVAGAALLCAVSLAAGDDVHPDLIGYRRCIPMEGFLRTDPGTRQIGLFRTRESSEIAWSRWSVG